MFLLDEDYIPAQTGCVTRRRGKGCCRGAPAGAEPPGLEELVEVGWVPCWV